MVSVARLVFSVYRLMFSGSDYFLAYSEVEIASGLRLLFGAKYSDISKGFVSSCTVEFTQNFLNNRHE